MAISALSGTTSVYGSSYNSALDYEKWVENANKQAEKLQSSLSTSKTEATEDKEDTSSSSSSSSSVTSTDKSGTSRFLVNYKSALEELESATKALRTSNKDNVFSKYESALKTLDQAKEAGNEDDIKSAQAQVDVAKKNIVTAVNHFADKYNDAVSFMKSNSDRSAAMKTQLSSMQRSLLTEGALSRIGMGLSESGELQVNEDKLNEALDKSYSTVKDAVGGQYGMAERAASKATYVLDFEPIERTVGATASSKDKLTDPNSYMDDFMNFAHFASHGSFNLNNYYAVGSILNLLV